MLDLNPVKHQWWLPNPNQTECLAHFVKECLSTSSNIMEVLHSSAKGSMASSIKEQQKKWQQYIKSKGPYVSTWGYSMAFLRGRVSAFPRGRVSVRCHLFHILQLNVTSTCRPDVACSISIWNGKGSASAVVWAKV